MGELTSMLVLVPTGGVGFCAGAATCSGGGRDSLDGVGLWGWDRGMWGAGLRGGDLDGIGWGWIQACTGGGGRALRGAAGRAGAGLAAVWPVTVRAQHTLGRSWPRAPSLTSSSQCGPAVLMPRTCSHLWWASSGTDSWCHFDQVNRPRRRSEEIVRMLSPG